ncbi:MAG: PIN domain-containing protein [Planctomycetes bacterium]|nr:PIN domain-containing protein [Planctomycetota bacterium]
MNVLDTNIWIYRHDTRDPKKQLAAKNLLSILGPLALPWQVGCEFIAASRKLAPIGFDEATAWNALADMQLMSVVVLMPVPQLWQEARLLQARHMLSFWDALMVAACILGGVNVLYTEDMGAPRQIDSLALVNPFLAGPNS